MKKLFVLATAVFMPVFMFAAPETVTTTANAGTANVGIVKAVTTSASAIAAPKAMPTSAMPTSAMPTSAMPTSAMPTSAMPTSTVSTSTVSTSTVSTQAIPSSAMPSSSTAKAADSESDTSAASNSNIEGLAPPAVETGAYEEPNEPEPVADETTPGKNIHKDNRKAKHFTIEQTLFTPSSIGTKFGYFVNENWKVAAEFSTIASLIANSTKERNDTYAVNVCFSPADEDWSPFYGVGFTRLDMVMNATNASNNDSLHVKRNIVGGYVTAGMNWITDSIFIFSVEFDLLAGYLRENDIDITNPVNTSNTNQPNIWANFGFTAGICF